MLPSFPKELTSENEAYSCGQVGFWLPSGRWTTQPGTAGRGSRDTEEVRPEERGGLVITEGRARPAEWAGGEQNPFFIPNHLPGGVFHKGRHSHRRGDEGGRGRSYPCAHFIVLQSSDDLYQYLLSSHTECKLQEGDTLLCS